jgi:hypothetical protein
VIERFVQRPLRSRRFRFEAVAAIGVAAIAIAHLLAGPATPLF